MYLFSEFRVIPVFILMALWATGGWLITAGLFELKPVERHLVGFGIGLVLSNWLGNLAVRILPMPWAFWISALVVLGFGVLLAWPVRKDLRGMLSLSWGQWLAFALLALFFTLIDRGLGILDDHQNLPILSMMAAGDIPPHFPFAANVVLGYHYFLLLLATQFMRVGSASPWVASDLAHGITMALAFLLAGLFALRLTNKPLAQFWGTLFAALSGGTRWLLLLLPQSIVTAISHQVQLIGSAAQNGPDLQTLLTGPWQIDGSGPVPFPFAFVSGIQNPGIMGLSGFGLIHAVILVLLVLLGTRVKNRLAWPVLTILLASLALANEVTFGLLCAGFFLVMVIWAITNRSLRYPASLWSWIMVFLAAGLFAVFQGGMLTETARDLIFKFASTDASYYGVSFHFAFPPAMISSHFGELSLFNPWKLLLALLEVGPVFLVFPLVLARGRAEFRLENWFEAGIVLSAILGLLMVFVEYSGTAGPTATTRLYGMFFSVCELYAIPLVWIFLEKRGQALQISALVLGSISIVSGVVLLSVQLFAFSHPVATYYLTELDVQAYQNYWNRLPQKSLVFDPVVGRGVTVLGRATDSSLTFYQAKPEFDALVKSPDPYQIHAAGYDYMYYNYFYWLANKKTIDAPCVKLLHQFTDIHQATGESGDFRRLVDITACTH